jgi:hypothetical protein
MIKKKEDMNTPFFKGLKDATNIMQPLKWIAFAPMDG